MQLLTTLVAIIALTQAPPPSKADQLSNTTSVVNRITKAELVGLRTLEIEMSIVFPGKSHTTMNLYCFRGHEATSIARVSFSHRSQQCSVR